MPAEGRIEANATSLLYGFTDDVIVEVAAADGASKVDRRSRSRLGRAVSLQQQRSQGAGPYCAFTPARDG